MSEKEHSDEHHLLASSRGGPNDWWNLRKKVVKKHRCFHMLFINFLPCEIVEKIKQWTNTKSGEIDKRKLLKKRGRKYIKIKCWETLFGKNARREKAIRIIKKNWSVRNQENFRGCFRYKECFEHNNPGNPKKICPIIEMYKRGEDNILLLLNFLKSGIIRYMEYLINQLIQQGYLKTPRIIEAFRKIKREDFVLENLKSEAYVNAPLPIGWGQTISQPLTVAFMLELLQPEPGDKILDIGSGSGWQTAMLAHIVAAPQKRGEPRPKGGGKIFAIERILELLEFGKKNVAKYNFLEKGTVSFICGDGSRGLEKEVPFDKIIAAAAAEKIPEEWKEQLEVGGRLVTPVQSSIWLLIKESEKKFKEQEFPGFAFVPLIEDK